MDKAGWLRNARHCLSPNHGERPLDTPISLLVIHNISLPPGEYGGPDIEDFFCNRLDWQKHPFYQEIQGLKVSAHCLIRRDGELVQFVPLLLRAWHAGQSCHEGRGECNDFSIGIELEGCDHEPYEPRQYQTLITLTQQLMALFPAITAERIVGHEHIAPQRKTDPGPSFDWNHYLNALSPLITLPGDTTPETGNH
ncbi:MAG: 1,6-anhydro-N-acetylmuramyl-L-alanine amidase AmpD [Halomonadaceae bacterium]|nr:MAG: 1,6-anhydro-N-acetylmuramyl-L-alanine amidase AmpD [Halomonadaceae bacterium]